MLKLANDGPLVMVDDNAGDLFFVERCYEASRVPNPWLAFRRGSDFLAMLEQVKAGHSPMPALVLLDLNMPGMNGLDVLSTVRADSAFEQLPLFCVLTSSRDPRDEERAKRLGVSAFFTKASHMDEYTAFFNALIA